MKRNFILCVLILQIGVLRSQTNWKYSDQFSAKCMQNSKSSQVTNVLISTQNDSIIISDSFDNQCCPKFVLKISDIQNDSVYVSFQDSSTLQCDCVCDFHSTLNIGNYTTDKLKINYNGSWYSIDGQDFAPIGAEWYYTEGFAFWNAIDYLKISSKRDTTINGKLCRVIQKEHNLGCSGRPDIEYLYEENGILRFWDAEFNRFQVLYDFNKAVNDFWMIEVPGGYWSENKPDTIKVVVDSISSMKINDKVFKALHVTYNFLTVSHHPYSYNSTIIEKIGDINYLFNFFTYFSFVCDGNYSGGLRCYNDPILGDYSTGIAESCTYVRPWNGLEESNLNSDINVFPNPVEGQLEVNSCINEILNAELTDITGRLISSQEFYSHTQFDLTNFQRGLYILTVKQKGEKIGSMKIVKK